ncbi:50S ribosomal protein L11 methyltransferase [Flavihumibacter sp. CACIAM 22H1]|uniref:50S ribosomal protein L11 methyltransferase n=1 Tax=Flavihumibacter sp. CACIAM 22H1 TaxID=1812911 RepID=UPI0007A8E400|nr:50S ribosomal protein L11 methyltransferase [Flavihumibacter sp. CACIAM 22H1]KYP12977.1 MAG: hypothetical protein A1D16_02240 [Flavihumibacter sp. CACIAM 22H1]
MANHYQQVSITVNDQETREILIALLADAGYEGFVENRQHVLAYITVGDFSKTDLETLLSPFGLTFELETIQERNWNAEWEAGFQPVQVGSFCSIRADFHPAAEGVRFDLVITPKMSFGTGHHATTWQMVAAMERLDFTGKTVLDFGTGTGILAILAEKLGASTVYALDNDTWSIENTQENMQRNQTQRVAVQLAADLDAYPEVDIILANINKHVILRELPAMVAHCKTGGMLVISGLLQSDEADLKTAIENLPLTLINKTNKDSWLCWQLQRT